MSSAVELKPVKDLLGMNFYIPDYQRGYRWGKQQAVDLLEDINAFAKKAWESEEIYCVQPLVVSEKEDDILAKCKQPDATLEDIKRYIKGSWNVVDGQQRLTTIYLILKCLECKDKYGIDYRTRRDSKNFLLDIDNKTEADSMNNIDYYHMYLVYSAIKDWLSGKSSEERELFEGTLLNRVNFIWYQVEAADEIAVFTRLNIGKIPLTDAELIKALFLNRTNFDYFAKDKTHELDTLQRRIAVEWDQIEHGLQNDEFWAFIHDTNYSNPTRIDFILDLIREKDNFKLRKDTRKRNGSKNKNKDEAVAYNRSLDEKIGSDEHKTFRYFNEAFNIKRDASETDWLNELWSEVKKYYQVFEEWYRDYRLYHYIGYLTAIPSASFDIAKQVGNWGDKTKDAFITSIKEEIVGVLKKKDWITDLKNYKFDQDKNKSKRECVEILLLHNIETIIQQNEKLISETKYNLPNFSKFPFHLYKKENWQVEHIRPNAGDDFKKDDAKKLYLSLAGRYFKHDMDLSDRIKNYLYGESKEEDFVDILTDISQNGGVLSEDDKNKICNYTLLDEATNKEYGNQIFPVKRAFIINKENGKKIKYSFENGKLKESDPIPEVAFVPPCTKNVFSKLYTTMPTTMINWNSDDAAAYWNDMTEKLKYYFDKLGVKY